MSEVCKKNFCPCDTVCPLKKAWDVLGGKWKIQLICALKNDGPTRYGELKRKLDGVTNTMLASSLRELEADSMVNRVQYNEMPLRVEYSLTERGDSVVEALTYLAAWGKMQ